MSDVPEPDYDETEETKQPTPVPPSAASPGPNSAEKASSTAPVDAAVRSISDIFFC